MHTRVVFFHRGFQSLWPNSSIILNENVGVRKCPPKFLALCEADPFQAKTTMSFGLYAIEAFFGKRAFEAWNTAEIVRFFVASVAEEINSRSTYFLRIVRKNTEQKTEMHSNTVGWVNYNQRTASHNLSSIGSLLPPFTEKCSNFISARRSYCRAMEERGMNILELPNFPRLSIYFWQHTYIYIFYILHIYIFISCT